jgi:uncharacterized LabA/DUF88 family protein
MVTLPITPLKFFPDERVGLFIDGANIDGAVQAFAEPWQIDWLVLRLLFEKYCRLIRAYYYAAYTVGPNEANQSIKFFDALQYNGFTVVSKPIREIRDYTTNTVRDRKGNLDIEIAVDMLMMAPVLDHIVLMSGDGDFRPAVQALKQLGKRVTIVQTTKTPKRVCSDDLRKDADIFVELLDLKKYIARDHNDRTKAALNMSKAPEPA